MIGRVFANSYIPFFLCMALTGFSNMFVNINASKITASWFEQEKLGILMGIFAFCGQLPEPLRQQRRQFCLIAGHLLLLYQQYSVLVYLFYGCFL